MLTHMYILKPGVYKMEMGTNSNNHSMVLGQSNVYTYAGLGQLFARLPSTSCPVKVYNNYFNNVYV